MVMMTSEGNTLDRPILDFVSKGYYLYLDTLN